MINPNSVNELAAEYELRIESLCAKVKWLEAENARLKTVPMKYRRMQFNAELQDQLQAEQDKVKVLTDKLISIGHVKSKAEAALIIDEAITTVKGIK